MKLIVLFGKPGVGKSYIGNYLQKYGFFYYESDKDYTKEMKYAQQNNQIISTELREKWIWLLIKKVQALVKVHTKLVVCQSFGQDRYRKIFKQNFPQAEFIYIDANETILNKRVASRNHHLSPSLAKKYIKLFEPISIAHRIIRNEGDINKIEIQLRDIINNE